MDKRKDVLADTSNKEYARIIKAIDNSGYKHNDIDSLKAYFDFEGIINGKKKVKYSIESRRTNINACINKNRSDVEYCDKLKLYLRELRTELDKIQEDQNISEKQKAKHMDWDELLKICVPAINNEKYPLEERILIGLYTSLIPSRNDFTHMKLYTEEPEIQKGTYFIINDEKKEIVINDHKQTKTKGTLRQPLPDRLADMIVMWFKDETEMFPIAENAMSLRIKRLFKRLTGKPLTICSLRHSHNTFMFKGAPMPKEARRIADAMGHSVEMGQKYRFAPEANPE